MHNELNLVHGDIKPHNILLFKPEGDNPTTPGGVNGKPPKFVVQLCDFGLTERVRHPAGKINYTGLRGTSGYFAPEMIGEADYDHGIDLFALGIMLFTMLGGYEPFFPPTNFTETVEFDANYWSHVSPECKSFIQALLSINPSNRIRTADAMVHPWFSVDFSSGSQQTTQSFGAPPNKDLMFYAPDELPGAGPFYEPMREAEQQKYTIDA